MLKTIKAMNISPKIVELVKLLYANSSIIVVTNDEKGKSFRTEGGVRQGCPLSPYLFIIVLELVAIEMREDDQINRINI